MEVLVSTLIQSSLTLKEKEKKIKGERGKEEGGDDDEDEEEEEEEGGGEIERNSFGR